MQVPRTGQLVVPVNGTYSGREARTTAVSPSGRSVMLGFAGGRVSGHVPLSSLPPPNKECQPFHQAGARSCWGLGEEGSAVVCRCPPFLPWKQANAIVGTPRRHTVVVETNMFCSGIFVDVTRLTTLLPPTDLVRCFCATSHPSLVLVPWMEKNLI